MVHDLNKKKLTPKQRKFLIRVKDDYPFNKEKMVVDWILDNGCYYVNESEILNDITNDWWELHQK